MPPSTAASLARLPASSYSPPALFHRTTYPTIGNALAAEPMAHDTSSAVALPPTAATVTSVISVFVGVAQSVHDSPSGSAKEPYREYAVTRT